MKTRYDTLNKRVKLDGVLHWRFVRRYLFSVSAEEAGFYSYITLDGIHLIPSATNNDR